jgi:phage shock protein PspC (stress-responsive transcriptional regulator)
MLYGVSGTTHGVEETLKDFWATRPRRPRRGRKIAGVAAGIGNRYGIDPVVIRVAFVVATVFGGAGALFYVLGWLFLPEQDDEAAPFEAMVTHKRSSTGAAFTVLLCLGLIPVFWLFFDNQFGGFAGAALVVGALFLLHRSRGQYNRPAPVAPPPYEPPADYQPFTAPMPGATAPGASAAAAAEPPVAPQPEPGRQLASAAWPGHGAEPTDEVPTGPPAWDPLGAAPFAWDLPEPSEPAPEPPAPRRKSKAGLFTVGAALVAGGGLALLAPYTGWLSVQHIVGVVLAVLGLGMVGGSMVRGGRGLIGLAVPLSVIGLGLTVIAPEGLHGVGDVNETPATRAQVQSSYLRSAGTVHLDLTKITDTSKAIHTRVRVDAGEILVLVPRTADVDVTCKANVGEVDCLGQTQDGPGSEKKIVNDFGPDGEGGLKIDLDVHAGAGHVEVRRG